MAITVQSVTNALSQTAKTVASAAQWLGRQIVVIGQGVWGALKTVASAVATAFNASKDFIVRVATAFAGSSLAVTLTTGIGSAAMAVGSQVSRNPVVRYGLLAVALLTAAYTGGALVANGTLPLRMFPSA